ncbi:hypothetical protein HY095_05535 [Candidatus Micrarchaeota archaeon]|nr:hypothetical protein [Candidatus Micrarchaeota archaeon]
MKEPYLSKRIGWLVFIALVFLDAFLDVLRGVEGNPLWIPVVKLIGINSVPLLVPLILPAFYLVVKALGWVVSKADKLPHAEEIILTALVVVYSVFDAWLIAFDFLGFRLVRSFYQMIPVMMAAGFAYALWAERAVAASSTTTRVKPRS